MHRLRGLAVLLGAIALAGPALAEDEAYCALINGPSYQTEANLRAARCFRQEDDGASRSYQCESDNGGATSFGGNWFAYRIHFDGAFDPRQRTRDCGATPRDSYRSWNNPVVADIHQVGSKTVLVVRAYLPLADSPDFSSLVYVVADSNVDGGLRALVDYPRQIGLTLPSSEVRVAGVDLITASPAQFEAALVSRGAQRLEFKCVSPEAAPITGCLIGDLTTTYPDPSIGASQVKATFVLGRTMTASYIFSGQQGYLTFVEALDSRYGSSTRTPGQAGCTDRRWTAGGVLITGEYCSETDAKISFDNSAVVSLFAFYRAEIDNLIADMNRPAPQTARPRGDMF